MSMVINQIDDWKCTTTSTHIILQRCKCIQVYVLPFWRVFRRQQCNLHDPRGSTSLRLFCSAGKILLGCKFVLSTAWISCPLAKQREQLISTPLQAFPYTTEREYITISANLCIFSPGYEISIHRPAAQQSEKSIYMILTFIERGKRCHLGVCAIKTA